MTFALLTDSSCALPAASREVARVPIIEVPLSVEHAAGRPTTSQPSAAALLEALDRASLSGTRPVIAPVLSSKLSGTAQALRQIVVEHGADCQVIDTLTTGGTLGLAVLAASRATSPAAAAAIVREVVAKSMTQLLVGDLKPLVTGGRLTSPSAMIGTALGIVPIIDVREGQLRLAEAVRGKKRARNRMIARALTHLGARPERAVPADGVDCFCHVPGDDPFPDEVAAALAVADVPVRDLHVAPLPEALTVHTGQTYWGLCLAPALAADIH
ncbi:DegV family protein [Bowdeniella massiliensis]|uniref:DegV family protein n=1 Tax=Bowdeniella massiliensis TaxID=2932264 RepID=UPI0020279DD3|nr:DegV family protein [Bowdeniella massiliensis]